MKRAVSVLIVFLVLEGAWSCPAWATSFTFTTIDFPGVFPTEAVGINDAGQIVGLAGQSGFLLSEGNFTIIDFPGNGISRTRAFDINDAGQIVGDFFDAFGGEHHGFLLGELQDH